MAREKPDHALQVQHDLIDADVRDALAEALMNATVEGHRGFTRVMLTIMAMTASGKVTHEQAEALTRQSELLFTSLMAQQIQKQQSQGLGGDGDPLARRLAEAQRGAAKIRPALTLSHDGAHELGLQTLNRDGSASDLLPAKPGKKKVDDR